MLLGGAFFWFVLWTLLCAYVGSTKNIGCLGAIAGFFIGPIALLILILYNPSPPAHFHVDTQKRIPCPNCGEMIVSTARLCRYCGNETGFERG